MATLKSAGPEARVQRERRPASQVGVALASGPDGAGGVEEADPEVRLQALGIEAFQSQGEPIRDEGSPDWQGFIADVDVGRAERGRLAVVSGMYASEQNFSACLPIL